MKIMAYPMFLKHKNNEFKIKGRVYIDGMKQCNCISKEGTSSPTVFTEGLVLSYIIDAMKGQYVTTDDIPLYFLQNDVGGNSDSTRGN